MHRGRPKAAVIPLTWANKVNRAGDLCDDERNVTGWSQKKPPMAPPTSSLLCYALILPMLRAIPESWLRL